MSENTHFVILLHGKIKCVNLYNIRSKQYCHRRLFNDVLLLVCVYLCIYFLAVTCFRNQTACLPLRYVDLIWSCLAFCYKTIKLKVLIILTKV